MERVHPPRRQPPPPPLLSAPKMERREIEKKRRNHMKDLNSKLYSLLPNHSSKEALPVPEQIDEAVQYIKSLQLRLEKSKEKKEKLLGEKRPRSCITSENNETSTSRVPRFEIHEMGPAMDVILISGLQKQVTFYSILRFLYKEGFEVVNANFSSSGNSMLQVAHAKVGKSTVSIRATAVSRRLKEVICGYPHSDLESRPELWDFQIEPDIWNPEILDTIPMLGVGEFSILNRVQDFAGILLP